MGGDKKNMKKKIIAIGIMGMFLLTSITAMSAAQEERVSEKLLVEVDETVCVGGIVWKLNSEEGLSGATVTCIAEDPETYSETTTTDIDGMYSFSDVPSYTTITVTASKKWWKPVWGLPNPYTFDTTDENEIVSFILRRSLIPGSYDFSEILLVSQISQQNIQ